MSKNPDTATIIDRLLKVANGDYPARPLPNSVDDEVANLVHLCLRLTAAERESMIANLTLEISSVLLTFSHRMAALGVREKDPRRLFDGLAAQALEGGNVDHRDNLVAMSLLYHSLRKLGLDADATFREVGSIGTQRMSELMAAFVRRPPELKSIEAMGYEETCGPDGFDYSWTDL